MVQLGDAADGRAAYPYAEVVIHAEVSGFEYGSLLGFFGGMGLGAYRHGGAAPFKVVHTASRTAFGAGLTLGAVGAAAAVARLSSSDAEGVMDRAQRIRYNAFILNRDRAAALGASTGIVAGIALAAARTPGSLPRMLGGALGGLSVGTAAGTAASISFSAPERSSSAE